MRTIRHIIVAALCLFLLCLGGCTIYTLSLFRSFDHLEQHAQREITASELQAWATNLLAQYPQTNMSVDIGYSNCPVQLRGLCPRLGPHIFILKLDDGRPPSVRIVWGSGFMGHEGFNVGPANFVAEGHKWQDGVYFYRDE